MARRIGTVLGLFLVVMVSVGSHCNNEVTAPSPTPVPTAAPTTAPTSAPSNTPAPTVAPPTATPAGPTHTPAPPTATVPPTVTVPPTSTPVPPTATSALPTATPLPGVPVITEIDLQSDPVHTGGHIDFLGSGFTTLSTFTLQQGGADKAILTNPFALTGGVEVEVPGTAASGTYAGCIRNVVGITCGPENIHVANP